MQIIKGYKHKGGGNDVHRLPGKIATFYDSKVEVLFPLHLIINVFDKHNPSEI